MDYSLVIGIDSNHISKLEASFPTWMHHKPSLKQIPLILFHDKSMGVQDMVRVCDVVGQHPNVKAVPWPPVPVEYEGVPGDRWRDPHRARMLSGFVYTAAEHVRTRYWLKLDLDVVATRMDGWVEDDWFRDGPAIVAQPWGYTKPAHQMMDLDRWALKHERDLLGFMVSPPLNLIPKPGSSVVRHSRIISWCSFFNTDFTKKCVDAFSGTCGPFKMPVPSQDGAMYYMAKRGGYKIQTVQFKTRGWEHWGRLKAVQEASKKALGGVP